MKFTCKKPCICGGTYLFSTYGDDPWPIVVCTECGVPANLMNNLSVSVTADRLLHRSKAELEDGDYTLSIVICTMAVETFLTRMFLRLKSMDAKIYNLPSPAQEKEWERDFPRSGGFARKQQILCPRASQTRPSTNSSPQTTLRPGLWTSFQTQQIVPQSSIFRTSFSSDATGSLIGDM